VINEHLRTTTRHWDYSVAITELLVRVNDAARISPAAMRHDARPPTHPPSIDHLIIDWSKVFRLYYDSMFIYDRRGWPADKWLRAVVQL